MRGGEPGEEGWSWGPGAAGFVRGKGLKTPRREGQDPECGAKLGSVEVRI